MINQSELKKQVGKIAATFVKEGMVVGLGTGSTANYLIREIGRRIQEEFLQITGVATSKITGVFAQKFGITLKTIEEVKRVDLTIDGADEISSDFQGIKGGGGALLFEKIVANHSNDYIWIVDETKMVEYLGAFPLPVEIVKFGAAHLFNSFKEKGYEPAFKMQNSEKFVTDSGHYIVDLFLKKIDDPHKLADELKATTGVVEHGLFLDMVKKVIVGTNSGARLIKARG